MDEQNKRQQGYEQAIGCLTPRLMALAAKLSAEQQMQAEELRLRAGQPVRWLENGQEHDIQGGTIGAE